MYELGSMLSILHRLSIIGCLTPKLPSGIIQLLLSLQMKQTWHWQSICFLRTCYVPPEQKPGFCHRRLDTRASVFIYDPICGRLHFTKVFKAVFLFPNLIPESCMPSSRCEIYFPSFWSYMGILTAQINSGVGDATLHAFSVVRGTTESTWLSQGALLWNPGTVVGWLMLSTDFRTVANIMVFEKVSIWMTLEFHMNNWGWHTLSVVNEHLCFTFCLFVLAFHLNQKGCDLHSLHISLGIATRACCVTYWGVKSMR